MSDLPILEVGEVYQYKRGKKRIKVLARGFGLGLSSIKSAWYYTVRNLETGEEWDQYAKALVPQLEVDDGM